MSYKCDDCGKDSKVVRHDKTIKGFICDDCYWNK